MALGNDLQCGNIYMQLEEPPNENNKIVLGKEKDAYGIPKVKRKAVIVARPTRKPVNVPGPMETASASRSETSNETARNS